MNIYARFMTAAAYVTVLPLRTLPPPQQNELSSLSKYLPAVGILIGLILYWLCGLLNWLHINPLLTSVIITISWLAITGAIHCDGLMDTADGIFSHRDPQRMLEIMSDSRVGNFGALTGFSLLLLKAGSLACLPYPTIATVVLLAPAWARWNEVIAIGCFPYLKENGMGKIWHDTISFPSDLYISALVPLFLSIIVGYLSCWIAILASASAETMPKRCASSWGTAFTPTVTSACARRWKSSIGP